MVQKLTIFAIMAAIAIAAPTYSGGNHGHHLTDGHSAGGKPSISVSVGFTGGVAGALEACWAGATSASVDVAFKKELKVWINGPGKHYFDFLTIGEISKWCTGSDYELTAITQVAISAALKVDAGLAAAGGAWVFLNGLIEKSHGGVCACQAIDHDQQVSLQAFLFAVKVASIDKVIYGSLKIAAAGGLAETLSVEALAALKVWLSFKDCLIKGDLLNAVQAWISISGGSGRDNEYHEGHGSIHADGGLNVVLTGSHQQSLNTFVSTPVFVSLDLDIQVGLMAVVAGGVAGSLDASIRLALSAFVSAPSCPLDADLTASILLWLSGEVSATVKEGTPIDAYAYISAGLDISGNFDPSHSLIVEGQAALSGFTSKAGVSIDAEILASLNVCAHGGLAASLEVSASAKLSAWIASPDCSLDVELRALVLVWLSVGISGSGGAGVGIDAGAGLAFDTSALVAISAGISASAQLSSTVKGALAVLMAGGVASLVDIEARAELASFLFSEAGVSVGVEVQAKLIAWLSGSDNCDCEYSN